eukprot:scaffold89764_cov29-Prasinocladus_malaysianus.AAC.1
MVCPNTAGLSGATTFGVGTDTNRLACLSRDPDSLFGIKSQIMTTIAIQMMERMDRHEKRLKKRRQKMKRKARERAAAG